MTLPVRLQLSRTKGYRLQDVSLATNGLPAVKVDRSTRWGNPWRIGEPYVPNAAEAVRMFRARFDGPLAEAMPAGSYLGDIARDIGQLRGKNLACWCDLPAEGKPDLCHAAVLIEIANRPGHEDDRHDPVRVKVMRCHHPLPAQ